MGQVWASPTPQGGFLSAIGPAVSASRRDLVCAFAHRPSRERKTPVVIVSLDTRNRHERASTVLVVPLTTSIRGDVRTHVFLSAGETGLPSDSEARAEDIVTVHKEGLVEPQGRLRALSDRRVSELAAMVRIAMGCAP